jgi:hypothetical protein
MASQALKIEAQVDRYVAPDRLVQIVRPFIGAKLNRARKPGCPFNSMLPRSSALDVQHIMNTVDADVRDVNAAGIELRGHDGFSRFVPWSEVRSITVRGRDADGNDDGYAVWLNAAARFPVRSAAA